MSNKILIFLFACLLALPATAQIVINEIHYDPADPGGDANGDGTRDATDDEFVEILNLGGFDVDVSGWTLSDNTIDRHTFPAGTTLSAGCGIVVFGGGTPTGTFGDMEVQTAGTLSLNNGGDTLTLNDGTSDVASETYPGTVDNQSITRDPDGTGSFVAHSTATGSGGALFSPGTQISGTNFPGCGGEPVAVDDSVTMDEDAPAMIVDVLANDNFGPDGAGNGAITIIGLVANGTAMVNDGGTPSDPTDDSISYQPAANFNGGVAFLYQIEDANGDTATATVNVTVNAVNDAPTANPQTVTTPEDTLVAISLTGADSDGNPLTFSVTTGPANGSLSGTPPNVAYTPNSGFSGADGFDFQVCDPAPLCGTATVTINVMAVANTPPVANPDGENFTQGSGPSLTVPAPGVLGNDTDADGDALSAVLASGPANGNLTLNPDGSFTYTPDAGFTGADSFTYTADDGNAVSAPATVTITVRAQVTATPIPFLGPWLLAALAGMLGLLGVSQMRRRV